MLHLEACKAVPFRTFFDLEFVIIVPFFFQKFGVNQSKPEFTVDLKGALIDWASKDKSSKKNVIEVNFFISMQDLVTEEIFSNLKVKQLLFSPCSEVDVSYGESGET